MIWPMANSQMLTSKNPSGARVFMPRDTKIVFMVASVTTHNSATKTSRGSRDNAGAVPSANKVTGPPPQQERRLHGNSKGERVPGTDDETSWTGRLSTTGGRSSQAENS